MIKEWMNGAGIYAQTERSQIEAKENRDSHQRRAQKKSRSTTQAAMDEKHRSVFAQLCDVVPHRISLPAV